MALMIRKDEGISAFPIGHNLFKQIGTIAEANETIDRQIDRSDTVCLCACVPKCTHTLNFL